MIELPGKGKKSPTVFCVEFNQNRLVILNIAQLHIQCFDRPHLLASGDEQGKVNVWHVSSKLKTQHSHEQEVLDTIMEHLTT